MKRPAPGAAQTSDVIVLGIESSCDETAAAVIMRDGQGRGCIMSNIVRSQWEKHRAFGGVVPEIAARAHVECLDDLVAEALRHAGVGFSDLGAVAVTAGPGLIGGLIVGLISAKSIALVHRLPLIAINHLEAHALTVGLTEGLQPPYVLLLVSGGHTQLLLVRGVADYIRLGTTIDDALGEAFDKTAKLLGLPQPGGPEVEAAARKGDPNRFKLPRPMLGRPEPNFSFAGLKTAVRQRAQAIAPLNDNDVADLCASFEQAVVESVRDRCARAIDLVQLKSSGATAEHGRKAINMDDCSHFVIAGGVAANRALRTSLADLAASRGLHLSAPPVELCGDNAAMVAWAGAERFARGWVDPLDVMARPRWPLDTTAPAILGAGRKGAKA